MKSRPLCSAVPARGWMDGRRTGVRRPRTARELGAISEDGVRSERAMKTEGEGERERVS